MEEQILHDASLEQSFEERSIVDPIREDGKITGYSFRILLHNKAPLTGKLTRDEVDLMFRLISREGANLTQKTVSRYFPLYTFSEFKKIKNAFNLQKDSAPFAPHMIEERTEDELINLLAQQKENNFLKKYEQTKEQITTQKYHELLKSNHELKQSIDDFSLFLENLKFSSKFHIKKPKISTDNTLMVYLADMHIGAEVSGYSIYENIYNKDEVEDRMLKVFQEIITLSSITNCTNIVICNLGDSLDGYNGQTTRGGHSLPQNMNNKDQYNTFITVMLELFGALSSSGMFNSIKYMCVGESNHDGDFGYIVNKALEASLGILNPEIEVRIFSKFIEHFKVNDITFILCHGKDNQDMFKNLPLVLNEKTENQVNEYIDYYNLSGKIQFVKGDLHQSAVTSGKRFKYKSVSSFFGSSSWIHKNFGNTPPAVDFDIIIDNKILETQLPLKK